MSAIGSTGPAGGEAAALTPEPLMRLATGFWSFKTFAAAVELEMFTKLADGREMTVEEFGAELRLAERPADLLLAACASLGLLDKSGSRYRNSALAEEFLVIGRPCYFGGFVRFCDHREYPAWHRVVEALRGNRPLTWDPVTQESVFSAEDPQMLALFWEAMHSISSSTARSLAQAVDLSGYRRLLDVGGGSGAYAIELCRRYPQLTAALYDLPHVCDIAAKNIQDAGLQERITTIAGDFQAEGPLPGGHDLVLLSMVLHDWDEAAGRALLGKCRQALTAGGLVMVCELLLNPERTGPAEAALMGMNMLVETEGGRNYSETQYAEWLSDAGFAGPRVERFTAAGVNGVVLARVPDEGDR